VCHLGSGLAAKATAERKTVGHLLQRLATRRQSLRQPNMISMRLRRLYLRLSHLMGLARDFRPGIQEFTPFSRKASLNQSASHLRSASSHCAFGATDQPSDIPFVGPTVPRTVGLSSKLTVRFDAVRCAFIWVASIITVLRSAPLVARPSIMQVKTPISPHRFQRLYRVLCGP
jgi:hypothetical protein